MSYIANRILALLADSHLGEKELQALLPDVPHNGLSTALYRLRRSYTKRVGGPGRKRQVLVKRRIYIVRWVQDRNDLNRYAVRARAIYAIGAGQDAPKPPPLTDYERTKRYTERHPVLTLAKRRRTKPLPGSSVFNLGQS